jgi:hypothetical protein
MGKPNPLKIVGAVCLCFLTLSLRAQTVQEPSGASIFANASLTNAYQFSSTVDLQNNDSVSIILTPGTVFPGHMGKVKGQWSQDGTTWVDDQVTSPGTTNSTEYPYTFLARTILVPLTSPTTSYCERFQRNARYFRLGICSTNAPSVSSTLSATAQKMNNQN